MGDFKDVAVKYWPWILGGVVGLYLVSRVGGDASAAPVSGSGMSQADQAYSLQAMQLSTASGDSRYMADVQKTVGLAQVQAGMFQTEAERDVAIYGINSDKEIAFAGYQADIYKTEIEGNVAVQSATIAGNTQIAVANIAASVQSIYAYADLQRAVNEPAITAINASSAENIASINALTGLAGTKYVADVDYNKHVVTTLGGMYATDADVTKTAITTMGDFARYLSPAVYPQGQPQVSRPDTSWLSDMFKAIGDAA